MIKFVPILPTKHFDGNAFTREIRKQVRERTNYIKQDFESTTATWNTRVAFTRRYVDTSTEISGEVSTANRVYCWVVLGTQRFYPILPRRASQLRYQADFTPKTQRFVIGSRPGGKSGEWVENFGVIHPGIAAREFDKHIAARHTRHFVNSIAVALLEGVKRSGHAY